MRFETTPQVEPQNFGMGFDETAFFDPFTDDYLRRWKAFVDEHRLQMQSSVNGTILKQYECTTMG